MRKVNDVLHMVPFRSNTMVMTGNWRQILRVMPRGSRAAIIASALKKTYLCPHFKTLRLTTNIRVEWTHVAAHREARAFLSWFLDIGDGKLETSLSALRDMLLLVDTMESIVEHFFPTMGREELISG